MIFLFMRQILHERIFIGYLLLEAEEGNLLGAVGLGHFAGVEGVGVAFVDGFLPGCGPPDENGEKFVKFPACEAVHEEVGRKDEGIVGAGVGEGAEVFFD